jgi:hypothetical protein
MTLEKRLLFPEYKVLGNEGEEIVVPASPSTLTQQDFWNISDRIDLKQKGYLDPKRHEYRYFGRERTEEEKWADCLSDAKKVRAYKAELLKQGVPQHHLDNVEIVDGEWVNVIKAPPKKSYAESEAFLKRLRGKY